MGIALRANQVDQLETSLAKANRAPRNLPPTKVVATRATALLTLKMRLSKWPIGSSKLYQKLGDMPIY